MKAYETAVRDAVMAEGRRFLETFLNGALPEMLGVARMPGSKGTRSRRVMTSMGEVALQRAYIPGRPCPMDEALGLTEGCTAEAASMMCFASAMSESYDKGEAAMRKLAGFDVAGRTMQRLVNAVSPRMEAVGADQAHEAFPRATAVVNTELDMTGVPMRPEDLAGTKGRDGDPRKKQIKVGVSFRQERDGDGRLGVVKSSIAHTVAYEDADAFGDRLYGWQTRRGVGGFGDEGGEGAGGEVVLDAGGEVVGGVEGEGDGGEAVAWGAGVGGDVGGEVAIGGVGVVFAADAEGGVAGGGGADAEAGGVMDGPGVGVDVAVAAEEGAVVDVGPAGFGFPVEDDGEVAFHAGEEAEDGGAGRGVGGDGGAEGGEGGLRGVAVAEEEGGEEVGAGAGRGGIEEGLGA